MPSSSWICTKNSKAMLLRIVHPGGLVELHERPMTAAEIMSRNPRCCVAYPFVFQQPWAIVAPDTVLMLGEKFYVVPTSSVRKLQMLSPNHSPSPSPASEITTINTPSVDEIRNSQSCKEEEEKDGMIFTCCIFRKKSTAKQSKKHKQHSKNESEEYSPSSTNLCESNTQTKKRSKDSKGKGLRGGPPKKAWSCEQWEPSLHSITEE